MKSRQWLEKVYVKALFKFTIFKVIVLCCTKKPLISQYKNNKVDIKGSIILELAEILKTSTGYLLNNECIASDMDEVEREMFALEKNMKSDKLRYVALVQLRVLATIEK